MQQPVPGIESFPPWLQAVLSVLTFIGCLVVYWRGLLKPVPPKSNDVIVPSLNVMDSAAIKEAAAALRETMRQQSDRDHMVRELQRELRRQTELLESIDDRERRNAELQERLVAAVQRQWQASRRDREEPDP